MRDIAFADFFDQIQDSVVPLDRHGGMMHRFPGIAVDGVILARIVFFGQQLPEPPHQTRLAVGRIIYISNNLRIDGLPAFQLILIEQVRHFIQCKIGDMKAPLDVER